MEDGAMINLGAPNTALGVKERPQGVELPLPSDMGKVSALVKDNKRVKKESWGEVVMKYGKSKKWDYKQMCVIMAQEAAWSQMDIF